MNWALLAWMGMSVEKVGTARLNQDLWTQPIRLDDSMTTGSRVPALTHL